MRGGGKGGGRKGRTDGRGESSAFVDRASKALNGSLCLYMQKT